MAIKISEIPAYTGSDIGNTSLVGTIVEGGVNVTYRVSTQSILNGIADLATDITGDFLGAADTFAGLPSSGAQNGDFAILRVVDGANPAGAYLWDGSAFIYTWPITTFADLSPAVKETERNLRHAVAYADRNGRIYASVSKAGVIENSVSRDVVALTTRVEAIEGSGTEPWVLYTDQTGINGVTSLTQSTGVGFKAYKLSTTLPLTTYASPWHFMPVYAVESGVTKASVYQPDSSRTDITFGGNGVPPERYISLAPLKETQDAGIDTQFTGATPTGNFYCETPMSYFAQRRMELRADKYVPVAITATYNGGNDTTKISVQLTSGATVTYNLPDRYVTIYGAGEPIDGNWKTLADGNAFTFQITVSGNVAAPTAADVTVYVHRTYERWLANVPGEGGQRVSVFQPDAVYGRRLQGQAKASNRLALEFGYPHNIHVIDDRQGEADMTFTTPVTVAQFKADKLASWEGAKANVKAVTGQKFDPIITSYQTGAHWYYVPQNNPDGLINVAQAQFELCRDGEALFVAPDYLVEVEDGVHPIAESIRIYAMYQARAVEDFRNFGERRWVYPTTFTQGSGFVDITFNVPYGNLVADGELFPLLTYWGFDAWASDNTTPISIFTGITMQSSTVVRISLSRAFAAGEYLSYGRGGTSTPQTSGYNITTDQFGGYGNIHDQAALDEYHFIQPRTSTAGGRVAKSKMFLRNYSPMFQHQF